MLKSPRRRMDGETDSCAKNSERSERKAGLDLGEW